MNWTHSTVYAALVKRFGEKDLETKRYTWLYGPQKFSGQQNCALLYAPNSPRFSDTPLLVNRHADTWQPDVFQALGNAIVYVRSDSASKTTPFDHYRILDWARFAAALGL